MSQTGSYEQDLETIEIEFLEALDTGQKPTLEDYVLRYPQLERELTEFILHAVSHRVRMKAVEKAGDFSDAEAAVERLIRETPVTVESFNQLMMNLRTSATALASSVNVPVPIIVKLQRKVLSATPEGLVTKLAHVLRVPREMMVELTRAVQPLPRPAGAYRATGKPQPAIDEVKTFEEVMMDLKAQGKVTEEQATEWLS